ncbi:MAG TPA: hydroxymethylglutaryl-CoA lyase [Terracidiphilus sp.]|nr:hydroxymethylglutaryl-CoA lyase [Terracidiphilus sp.]
MDDEVTIVECPRDAWQGLPRVIPAERKAAYLRALIDAGFRHMDAVSFVSPAAVPQMADSERVLEMLHVPDDVEVIGIVVNEKGAERAIGTGKVRTLGFPYSISAEFLRRNQRQTKAEALRVLRAIHAAASSAGVGTAAYVSMAFGNPYGEAWSADAVMSACGALAETGVTVISLADTVGVATTRQIAETVAAVHSAFPDLEAGVHLHARPGEAGERVKAAYDAGCRRFDGAIGGLGGCPFAQDALVGNLATEMLVHALQERGAHLPEWGDLAAPSRMSAEIAHEFGAGAQ